VAQAGVQAQAVERRLVLDVGGQGSLNAAVDQSGMGAGERNFPGMPDRRRGSAFPHHPGHDDEVLERSRKAFNAIRARKRGESLVSFTRRRIRRCHLGSLAAWSRRL
jgi:hypothetical protein